MSEEKTEEAEAKAVTEIVAVESTDQMTEYQSHKKVHAEKILKIIAEKDVPEDAANRPINDGAQIVFENNSFLNVEPGYLTKHVPQVGGYVVLYEGGYASFSPADAFEAGNIKIADVPPPAEVTDNQPEGSFGPVLNMMKDGEMIRRLSWPNGVFIFMQVPANIPADIVPGMQSLPESVKAEFKRRHNAEEPVSGIRYRNQIAMVLPDNSVVAYSPTITDNLADDWVLYVK